MKATRCSLASVFAQANQVFLMDFKCATNAIFSTPIFYEATTAISTNTSTTAATGSSTSFKNGSNNKEQSN